MGFDLDSAAPTVSLLGLVDQADVVAVPSANTNGMLKAANPNRNGLSIYNDSTAILFVKMGLVATSTLYTVQIASQQLWEMPVGRKCYTGQVDGIWAAANGNALVTEW